jgi:hypothetical protein
VTWNRLGTEVGMDVSVFFGGDDASISWDGIGMRMRRMMMMG